MGQEKTTTVSNTTSERTPTAEETRLNQLDIQLREATQPGLISTQTAGLDLAGKMLRGEQLPEGYQSLWAGIDEGVTSSIVGQSLKDIAPGFQAGGILDSGVAADISARTAADIRRASAEFNIGTKLNLLNLALSGQAQVQSPILSQAANLGQRLGTLGKQSTSGTSTTYAMNPFVKSFQTSLGQSMGQLPAQAIQGMMIGCWVAAEVFGGWDEPKTCYARFYINELAPKWFTRFYLKHGEKFAEYIKTRPVLKAMIKPLFELFAKWGAEYGYVATCH